jgi:putative acetyltransferase
VIVQLDDLRGPEIAQLLQAHLDGMRAISPEASVHALNLEALRKPEITFWSIWEDREGGQLCGCGAIKQLNTEHAELKSMRTASTHLRQGVAATLLTHIISAAKARGLRRLSLETGSTKDFEPAHKLYERFGFERCGPIEGYVADPFSVFMTKAL